MYNRKRYTPLNEGGKILDFIKSKASNAAGSIAKAAADKVKTESAGIKLPPVSVGIDPASMKKIYIGLGILSVAALGTALIATRK